MSAGWVKCALARGGFGRLALLGSRVELWHRWQQVAVSGCAANWHEHTKPVGLLVGGAETHGSVRACGCMWKHVKACSGVRHGVMTHGFQ